MKELSRITESFTLSVILKMTRICDAAGHNLSQGFSELDGPKAFKEDAVRAIHADLKRTPATFGEPKLRMAISRNALRYNGISIEGTRRGLLCRDEGDYNRHAKEPHRQGFSPKRAEGNTR